MYLFLIIGHTGQGKTNFLNSQLLLNGSKPNPYVKNKNLYFLTAASKRQYIFDVNNEYELPSDIAGVKNHFRHIDCDIKKFMATCKVIRNCNIVIEDATGFLRGRQSADFSRLLTSKIHTANNYIILFHSINRVPPELMEMANFVILFKTIDNIDSLKKFKNENLTNAFLRLQTMPQYSNETIKLI